MIRVLALGLVLVVGGSHLVQAAQSASTSDRGARPKPSLQLDQNGRKWIADAALKHAMTAIRESRKNLQSVRPTARPEKRYSDLVYVIQAQSRYAFQHMRLSAAAEANAKLILFGLVSGANRLTSTSTNLHTQGLAEIDEALKNYNHYFSE